MMSCEELSRLMASDELATLGWGRRLRARLHLLMCRHCRRYAKQIRTLGDIARSAGRNQQEEDASARERLEESILNDVEKPALD